MSKLYACIAVKDVNTIKYVSIAKVFAYQIETLEDAVLFEISGLEKIFGDPNQIAKTISEKLAENSLVGNVAISNNAETALLLARNGVSKEIDGLPINSLAIDKDALKVFGELGVSTISELKKFPKKELIARYGQEFSGVLDLLEENGKYVLTPNIRENTVSWSYNLDSAIEEFERLIFILGHGLSQLLEETKKYGFSSEQIDVTLNLDDKTTKLYQVKASFPTLDKNFWLKLINFKIGLDLPEAAILSVLMILNFTRPRAAQYGLFSASRLEPESLLLTVNKIKKLVGEENVGVPVLLNDRLAEAFELDWEKLPLNLASKQIKETKPIIALSYFRPPLPAQVGIQNKRLTYLKTARFYGKVLEYSGVWKANSHWWGEHWQTLEWDVEVENHGVYRLANRESAWLIVGEYD